MNTLEDELRQLLADPPRPPVSRVDAADRVRAGIHRRRRRTAVIGTAVLTVAALAVGVVVGAVVRDPAHRPEPVAPSPTPTPGASAIPWQDLPSVEYPAPGWSPRPDATPCRASDLSYKGVHQDGAGGTLFTVLSFTNS